MMITLLIENYSESTKEKLTRVYQSYKKDIYLTAYDLLKDHHAAEDIVQSVIIKLSNNLDTLDRMDQTKIKSYILITTRNCCFDVLRKNKGTEYLPLELIDKVYPELFSHYDDYFKQIISCPRLTEALTQISPVYSDIITLRYFHAMSIKEISHVLNITENNASVKLYRALSNLSNLMTKEGLSNEKSAVK